MPQPIAIQLYPLRHCNPNEFREGLRQIAGIGYAGVELFGLHDMKAKELRKLIEDLGLRISSAFLSVFNPDRTSEAIESALALGIRDAVDGFGAEHFESEAAIRAAAGRVNAALEKTAAAGLRVSIHNHHWEFAAPNRGELLLELCPKAYAELDIYWITLCGADPIQLLNRYAERLRLLHVQDGPGVLDKPKTALGQGQVNVKAALQAAEKTQCEWCIVEADVEGDVLAAARESYRYLIGNNLAVGKK